MAIRLRHRLVTLRDVLSGFFVRNQIAPLQIASMNSDGAGGRVFELRRCSTDAAENRDRSKDGSLAENGRKRRRTTGSKARFRIINLICVLLPSVLLAIMVVIWIEDGVRPLIKSSTDETDTDCDRRSRVASTILNYVVIAFDHSTENRSNATDDRSFSDLLNGTGGCNCVNSSCRLVRFLSACRNNSWLCGASGSVGVDFVKHDGSDIVASVLCNSSNLISFCSIYSSLSICDSFNAERRHNSTPYNQTSSVCCIFENSNNSDDAVIGCNLNNFQAPSSSTLSSSSPSSSSSSASSASTKDLYVEVFLPVFVFLLHFISAILVLRFSARRFRHQIRRLESTVSLVELRWVRVRLDQQRSNQLLSQMLPGQIADRLKGGQTVDPETFDDVTVYFSDIPGFNTIALTVLAIDIVNLLNSVFSAFDDCIKSFQVYKVETIGDSYLVVSGLPVRIGDIHSIEMGNMALEMMSIATRFSLPGDTNTLPLRIGINTGSVVAGVIGLKNPRYCLFGDTVNTASRMNSTGKAYMIQCSEEFKTAAQETGSFVFEERGTINVKGKGSMTTYWLLGKQEPAQTCFNV